MNSFHRTNVSNEEGLLNLIDEEMSGLLGEGSWQAILFHLKTRYGVQCQEILHKPKAFIDALSKIFGPGTKILAYHMIQGMRRRFGPELPDDFSEAIRIVLAKLRGDLINEGKEAGPEHQQVAQSRDFQA